MDETTIRRLQERARWGVQSYTAEFRADPRPHRDAAHAVLHVCKAHGKLVTLWLSGFAVDSPRARDAMADVAICVMRAASTWPCGPVNVALARASARDAWWPRHGLDLRLHVLGAAAGSLAGLIDRLDHGEPCGPDAADVPLAGAWLALEDVAAAWDGVDLGPAIEARMDATGMGPRVDAAPAAPPAPQCPHVTLSDVCALPTGHDGPHRWQSVTGDYRR
jgi:hypothetical protein